MACVSYKVKTVRFSSQKKMPGYAPNFNILFQQTVPGPGTPKGWGTLFLKNLNKVAT